MFRQYRLQDFRLRLVVLVYAITILGILVIGRAAEEYQSQQLLGMILGTVAMLVLTLMDYRILLNLSWVLYAVNIILLLAGKTGTAQQSKSHPNHALFMGYAPYESPQIAIAIRIANGYTSANAASMAADIFSYYFDLTDKDELLNGSATTATSAVIND